ncbi:MAG: rod shape-determining protein MreC [Bacteriovoracaceae bacterium]|nr:rod shape-determining protein MreC [Bacteriovoracaceae bacterium]
MRRIVSESSKIKIINNLLVLVFALYGISQKRFDLEEMTLFQKIVVEVVAPVQKGLSSGREELVSLIDNYVRIVNTSKENAFLKKKIDRLENDLFQMEEIRRENFRLKQMLSYSEDIGQSKVLAQVIGWDSANQFKVLRLNRGSNDGIKVMSPVITHLGLVGYIYRVGTNYSDVLTILDPNNRVDALVERTRTHGIVEGVFNYHCSLKYISRTDPVEVGDKLITAGVGGIYPKGVKVGMVTDIDRETTGMTLGVEITPSVDFHKLEEVLVLLPKTDASTAQTSTEPSVEVAKGH